MKTVIRKFLSVFLSALLLITCVPAEVLAHEKPKTLLSPEQLSEMLKDMEVKTVVTPYKIGKKESGELFKYFRDGKYEFITEIPQTATKITLTSKEMGTASKSKDFFFDIVGYTVMKDYKGIVKAGDFITSTGEVISSEVIRSMSFFEKVYDHPSFFILSNAPGYPFQGAETQFFSEKLYRKFLMGDTKSREEICKKILLGNYEWSWVEYLDSTLPKTFSEVEREISGSFKFAGLESDIPLLTKYAENDMVYVSSRLLGTERNLDILSAGTGNGAVQFRVGDLEDIIDFYEETINDFAKEYNKMLDLTAEKGTSQLDHLAERYLSEYMVPADKYLNLKQELATLKRYKKALSGNISIEEFTKIHHSLENSVRKMYRKSLEVATNTNAASESLLKFIDEIGVENFLKIVYERTIEIAMEAGKEDLAEALKITLSGNISDEALIKEINKIRAQYHVFSKEATAQVASGAKAVRAKKGLKAKTIPELLGDLSNAPTPEARQAIVKQMEKKLPKRQKDLIRDILRIDESKDFAKGLLKAVEDGGAAAGRNLGAKALRVVSKALIPVTFVASGLLTFSLTRTTRAVTGNGGSVDMVAWGENLKERILRNEASPQEMSAYMQNPATSSEIKDDPILFAACLFGIARGLSNPNVEEMYQADELIVENWDSEEGDATPLLKQGLKGLKYREDSHKKGTNAA